MAHVVDVNRESNAHQQVAHHEGNFEILAVVNGRPGAEQNDQRQHKVRSVRFYINVRVTGVIQFQLIKINQFFLSG